MRSRLWGAGRPRRALIRSQYPDALPHCGTHSCSRTQTSKSPAGWRNDTTREPCALEGPDHALPTREDVGRDIAQGRGKEDLIVPAVMLAISLTASSTSASPTASNGIISMPAEAKYAR